MRLREIISEGGNAFKGDLATQRINKSDVPSTVAWLGKILELNIADSLLGTTGKTATSGDIDVGIQDNAGVTKETLVQRLTSWCVRNKLDPRAYVKKSGVNVHFRTPINGDPKLGHVQTDLMLLPNLELAKFTMTPNFTSKYKDAQKHILLSSVAKFSGLKWIPTTGLVSRTTGKVVADDPEHMTEILLGPNATTLDLTSVEGIMRHLDNDPEREAKIADAKATLGL